MSAPSGVLNTQRTFKGVALTGVEGGKSMGVDENQFQSFLKWQQKQELMKVNGTWLMNNIIAWNDDGPKDKYPEDREVVDVVATHENLERFLEVYAAQVRSETLNWVSENLFEGLEQRLEEHYPGVSFKEVMVTMVRDYDWKEEENEQTVSGETGGAE